jgi:HEAT repeat protein
MVVKGYRLLHGNSWIKKAFLISICLWGLNYPLPCQDDPIKGLIQQFADEDPRAREEAVRAVAKLGPNAVDPLAAALKSPVEYVRREAVAALAQINDPGIIDLLISALKDGDSIVGHRAAKALGNNKDPRAFDALVGALSEKSLPVRIAAAGALGNMKDPRAIEPLTAALNDSNPFIRTQAAEALRQIKGDPSAKASSDPNAHAIGPILMDIKDPGEKKPFSDEFLTKQNPLLKQKLAESEKAAPEPVATQIKTLRNGDTQARADAAAKLATAGTAAQGAILALLETLCDPRADRQVYIYGGVPLDSTTTSPAGEAAEALAAIGPPAVESIIAILKYGDPGSRQAVVRALGPVKELSIAEALIPVMEDENPATRMAAIQALGTVRDPKNVNLLIAALKDQPVRTRSGAAAALGQTGTGQAIEPLINALKDGDSNARLAVIEALGEAGDPRAADSLVPILKDKDPKSIGNGQRSAQRWIAHPCPG